MQKVVCQKTNPARIMFEDTTAAFTCVLRFFPDAIAQMNMVHKVRLEQYRTILNVSLWSLR